MQEQSPVEVTARISINRGHVKSRLLRIASVFIEDDGICATSCSSTKT